MSEYDYDERRRARRVRERSPEYVTETTYIQRGAPSRELVYRPRDREDSIEDIPREFPPPNAEYRRTKYRDEYIPRRTRSAGRRGYYDDDYYNNDDYGAAVGGAAYGARPRNRRRDSEYYSDDDYDRHPRRERRKSKVEEVLGDLGLAGVAAAVTKQLRSRSRSRPRRHRSHSRDDDSSDSDRSHRSRRRSGSRDARRKWQQAAKAAVIAGATEAFRSRKEPGGWTGAKGQRVATAALGAAGIDGFLDKDPDHHSKRHVIESVVGGLAANRIANGPRGRSGSRGREMSPSGRSRSRSRSIVDRIRSRSRSVLGRGRSHSRGGSDREGGGGSNLKKVAALGGVAAAGKAIYDRVRSKSRGRRRSPSASSEDSYVPSRRQRYHRDRGGPDNGSDDAQDGPPRGREEERGDASTKRDSSASTVSTTDLENRRKRTRGKELLTAGLATVATIHAAHGVYSSMVASEKRHKLVLEGEMTPQDARKRKSKNMLQDAAAVGIAALSIKSAFGEWKEMNEQREELHELEARRRKRKKERERREREARMNPFHMMGGGANPYPLLYSVPYPHPQMQQMQPAGPVSYQDGNPYGNIPPPPMGAPPPNRY